MKAMKGKLVGTAALCLAAIGLITTGSKGASAPSETPKGYVIAEIKVTNPDAYQEYVAQVTPVVAACGGRYLVRAGASVVREGAPLQGRMVVIEYPSFAAAQACLDGPEYKAVERLRTANAVSRIAVVEGLAP